MRDSKNPNRWRRVIQCRTADCGPTQKSFKDAVLEPCDQRDDEWAHKVKLRIGGAVSDLHVADAHYHKDCMENVQSHRNIQATLNAEQHKSAIDEPLMK